ncbi:MAG: hypothetical protein RL597_762 [Pseudomonadota bacterium]
MNRLASSPPAGQFTIKAVSQATGLTVETLRAWERRYEVVRPSRDSSGRRTYSAADVARLRLLRTATELGHTISRLAGLPDDALAKLVADSGGQARPGPTRGQSYVERAIDATEHSDPSGVEEVLTSAVALLPPNEVVNTVLVPLVREIGERWHRGEVSIAQEHMVTDIVRRLIISVSRGYLRSDNGPCLVLSTLSGVDVPPEELARFALEVDARAVLVSLVMPENEVPALDQLRALADQLRGRCEVWVGGFAARLVTPEELPAGCILLPTGGDFEQRLDLLAAQHFS